MAMAVAVADLKKKRSMDGEEREIGEEETRGEEMRDRDRDR